MIGFCTFLVMMLSITSLQPADNIVASSDKRWTIDDFKDETLESLSEVFKALEATDARQMLGHSYLQKKLGLTIDVPKYPRYTDLLKKMSAIHCPCIGLSDEESGIYYTLLYYGLRNNNGTLKDDTIDSFAKKHFILIAHNTGRSQHSVSVLNTADLAYFLEKNENINVITNIPGKPIEARTAAGITGLILLTMIGIPMTAAVSRRRYYGGFEAKPETFLMGGLSLGSLVGAISLIKNQEKEHPNRAYNGIEPAYKAMRGVK